MLARFRAESCSKPTRLLLGSATGPPPKLNGNGLATRAVRLLSRRAVQHAEVIRIEALRDPCNSRLGAPAETAAFNRKGSFGSTSSSTCTRCDALSYSLCDPISDGADRT